MSTRKRSVRLQVNNMAGNSTTYVPDNHNQPPLQQKGDQVLVPYGHPVMEIHNYGGQHRTLSVGGGRPIQQVYHQPIPPAPKPHTSPPKKIPGLVNICNNRNVHNSFNTNAVIINHHQQPRPQSQPQPKNRRNDEPPICINILDDDDSHPNNNNKPEPVKQPTIPPIRVESDEPCEDSSACIVCLERKSKCAIFPCRHLRYCNTCTLELIARPPLKCALCSEPATHFEPFL